MRSVFAVDVGGLANVGWARFASNQPPEGSRSFDDLVERMAKDVANGWSLALGFEAPCFLPIPENSTFLNRARPGEGNHPWCAGAGAVTTAIGVQQSAWVVRALASGTKATHDITTDWHSWPPAERSRPIVLLWEAFVSGAAHSPSNNPIEDAATAAHAFLENEHRLAEIHAVSCDPRLSLLGTVALWSGWSTDIALLRSEPLVVRPKTRYLAKI
jgi:hypothetical protein